MVGTYNIHTITVHNKFKEKSKNYFYTSLYYYILIVIIDLYLKLNLRKLTAY